MSEQQHDLDDVGITRTRLWTEAESKVAERAVKGFREGKLISLVDRDTRKTDPNTAFADFTSFIESARDAERFDRDLARFGRVYVGGEEVGEAVTFSTEDQHAISGLTSEESETLSRVLDNMREHPDGAVVVIEPEHKDSYERFVESLNSGLLPVYLNPELAAYCIHRGEGDPKLVFGVLPEVRAARHLATAIDQALKAAEPELRKVDLKGHLLIEGGGDSSWLDQPVIVTAEKNHVAARELAPLNGSTVSVTLRQINSSVSTAVSGILHADPGSVIPGDEVEPENIEPPVIGVGNFDLLGELARFKDSQVELVVDEIERLDVAKPATVEAPKTPEEDVIGKTRVALAAAKLIQANREYVETPDGESDNPGTPSLRNDAVIHGLTYALECAEEDAANKGLPAKG